MPPASSTAVPPAPCRLRTREHKGLRSQELLSNSSACRQRLHPPPRACRTLHGDGRVALLRVLGAFHLQLLGRERRIRAALGGKVIAQGHGIPPSPFLHPDTSSQPQPGHSGGHTWALGWRCGLYGMPGAALAVPSTRDTTDPCSTLEQDSQPRSSTGRLLVPLSCCGVTGRSREQACSHRGSHCYRGARHGDAANRR